MLESPAFVLPAGPELIIVLAIIVLLFGANKLPELARSGGQAMGEFNRGQLESAAALEADRENLDSFYEDEDKLNQESVVHDDNREPAGDEKDSKSTQ